MQERTVACCKAVSFYVQPAHIKMFLHTMMKKYSDNRKLAGTWDDSINKNSIQKL